MSSIYFPRAGAWSREEVFFSLPEYMTRLCLEISKAKHSIQLECFIFESGQIALQLMRALEAAAKRGVQIQVVFDGFGARTLTQTELTQFERLGVHTRIYHPLPRPFAHLYRGRWPNFQRAFTLLLSWNRRTHRKLCVIDRSRAFIGSANLSDRFLAWRETIALVEGHSVASIQNSFDFVWNRSVSPLLPNLSHHPLVDRRNARRTSAWVRTNHTLRLRLRHRLGLQRLLRHARHRVWIETAYFVPSPMLLRALVTAAKNGADVRVILPRKSDVAIVRWVSQLFQATLIRAGIQVYEYLPTMLHAKTLVIDDIALVGSTNLNYRSFYHDLEIDLVLNRFNAVQAIARQFEQDLSECQRISERYLNERPLAVKMAGYLASLLKNWL